MDTRYTYHWHLDLRGYALLTRHGECVALVTRTGRGWAWEYDGKTGAANSSDEARAQVEKMVDEL